MQYQERRDEGRRRCAQGGGVGARERWETGEEGVDACGGGGGRFRGAGRFWLEAWFGCIEKGVEEASREVAEGEGHGVKCGGSS